MHDDELLRNLFRKTSLLWGESTGDWWFILTLSQSCKALMFPVSLTWKCGWFETPWRPCDVTVIKSSTLCGHSSASVQSERIMSMCSLNTVFLRKNIFQVTNCYKNVATMCWKFIHSVTVLKWSQVWQRISSFKFKYWIIVVVGSFDILCEHYLSSKPRTDERHYGVPCGLVTPCDDICLGQHRCM